MDEELTKIKKSLISELNVQYKNLVNFLQQVPIDIQFKQFGFQNFDQGLMWFEKGITFIKADKKDEKPQDQEEKDLEVNKDKSNENSLN